MSPETALAITVSLLTVLSTLVSLWWFDRRRAQRDSRREQRIEIALFGLSGTNGLVSDMRAVKREMYDRDGAVPRIRHHVAGIRQALALRDIETPDH